MLYGVDKSLTRSVDRGLPSKVESFTRFLDHITSISVWAERTILRDSCKFCTIRIHECKNRNFRSKKLPDWWGKKEDADLLKAAHLYGHKFFKKMK